MQNYNPNDEINYLTQIFGILKDKMNNGIIVFSIDNYEQTENYRIIGKLQKVIDKPIENFLILLNKIDKSSNKESDLEQLCCKIMEYFPNHNNPACQINICYDAKPYLDPHHVFSIYCAYYPNIGKFTYNDYIYDG